MKITNVCCSLRLSWGSECVRRRREGHVRKGTYCKAHGAKEHSLAGWPRTQLWLQRRCHGVPTPSCPTAVTITGTLALTNHTRCAPTATPGSGLQPQELPAMQACLLWCCPCSQACLMHETMHPAPCTHLYKTFKVNVEDFLELLTVRAEGGVECLVSLLQATKPRHIKPRPLQFR